MVDGDIEEVLAQHRFLSGPVSEESSVDGTLVSATRTQRQAVLLLRDSGPTPQGWAAAEPDLESLVMGYLRASRDRRSPTRRG